MATEYFDGRGTLHTIRWQRTRSGGRATYRIMYRRNAYEVVFNEGANLWELVDVQACRSHVQLGSARGCREWLECFIMNARIVPRAWEG